MGLVVNLGEFSQVQMGVTFSYPRRLAVVQAAAAAGSVLSPPATTILRGLGGLAGPVYEARSFI